MPDWIRHRIRSNEYLDRESGLAGVLKPLAVPKMPLAEPPPRDSRFGSPLKLSKVPWK